jgi:hypothetical protein
LLSTNHKSTHPCYFPPATQAGEELEYFDKEF